MSEEKNIEGSDKPQGTSDKPKENSELKNEQSVATASETSNQRQATENMETHAHHLHKAPGKKWTHYFFEFLMLFLAVFAGFLAENWREHIVEKHRAHQFLQSMLLDVQDNMKHLDSLMHEDHVLMA